MSTCPKWLSIPTKFSLLRDSAEVDFCRLAVTTLWRIERLTTKPIGSAVERWLKRENFNGNFTDFCSFSYSFVVDKVFNVILFNSLQYSAKCNARVTTEFTRDASPGSLLHLSVLAVSGKHTHEKDPKAIAMKEETLEAWNEENWVPCMTKNFQIKEIKTKSFILFL